MDKNRKIAIASEHAGYELKEKLKLELIKNGYELTDLGVKSDEPADYPYIAANLAERVVKGEFFKGILLCGTGIGMTIAAGKVPGARAALCTNSFMAKMAREHNDANILCLGAWITGYRLTFEIVEEFLNSDFSGGRHERRIGLIKELEEKYSASCLRGEFE
jgi:ribose 5-phosphate isomerase B